MSKMKTLDNAELEILCWKDWYDGPLSGLLSWNERLCWFSFSDRWGVDEETDTWEDDWGYIYEVFELDDQQLEEAITWFIEKGEWFHQRQFQRLGIQLRDWDGPDLSTASALARFSDKQGIKGGGHEDFCLPPDFKWR